MKHLSSFLHLFAMSIYCGAYIWITTRTLLFHGCLQSLTPNLKKAFFQEKDEFYYESDDDVFLDVIVNRLSFLKDFDKEIYTKTIISHNSELFKKEIK